MSRQFGLVKFFATDKGYGFIAPEVGGKDIFVHVSALEAAGIKALPDGTKVSFETQEGRNGKGPQACELQIESGEPDGNR